MLAEAGCSIIDINQTVVGGKFAMVIIADISRAKETASALKERFRAEGDRLGVRIYAQRDRIFDKEDLTEDFQEMVTAEVNRRVDLAEFCDWAAACGVDPVAAVRRFTASTR